MNVRFCWRYEGSLFPLGDSPDAACRMVVGGRDSLSATCGMLLGLVACCLSLVPVAGATAGAARCLLHVAVRATCGVPMALPPPPPPVPRPSRPLTAPPPAPSQWRSAEAACLEAEMKTLETRMAKTVMEKGKLLHQNNLLTKQLTREREEVVALRRQCEELQGVRGRAGRGFPSRVHAPCPSPRRVPRDVHWKKLQSSKSVGLM